MKLVEVRESNKGILLDYLHRDVARHAFALFDLNAAFQDSEFYVAASGGRICGYLLIYKGTALRYPSIIIDAELEAAETLLTLLPDEKAILFCPRELLAFVRTRVKDSGVYQETQMAIRKGEERLIQNNPARRLTLDDAGSLATLYSEMGNANRQVEPEPIRRQLALNPFYGIYDGGKLVSVAGLYVLMPEVCVIGGVFTHSAHRGRGFAKMTTSAVLECAFRISGLATLYVRSDNQPAIRVYEQLGFGKVGERFWVDLGTGLRP